MTLFVAYGYRDNELWVRDLVIPLLRDLGVHTVDGEEIPHARISDEIRARIAGVHALLGFLLRRELNPDRETWQTSRYVEQEINVAIGQGKRVIQVVEHGVRPVDGMLTGDQYLQYDSLKRADFLVKLVSHLRTWMAGEVELRLAPEDLVDALAVRRAPDRPQCTYDLMRGSNLERSGTGVVFPRGGGMYVRLSDFFPGLLADLTIEAGGKRWIARGVDRAAPELTIELKPTNVP